MIIIESLLGIIAVYCFGAWLCCCWAVASDQGLLRDTDRVFIEARWLGLCGILCLGFLGLLLK